MRAVYTVLVRRWSDSGTKDAHGNSRPGYSDPEPLNVFGIAPTASSEPGTDRMAVTSGISLLMPPDAFLGPHDLVTVDGEVWKVEGEVADYTRGPFGYRPGKTVALTREEG